LVLLQYVQRICTKTPTLDSRFVTCNSFLQTGTSSFSTSGTGVGIQTSESALRACCLPGTQCPVCPSLPRVRRSDIRNSQAPSLLTKRSRVRNLFGEPNSNYVNNLYPVVNGFPCFSVASDPHRNASVSQRLRAFASVGAILWFGIGDYGYRAQPSGFQSHPTFSPSEFSHSLVNTGSWLTGVAVGRAMERYSRICLRRAITGLSPKQIQIWGGPGSPEQMPGTPSLHPQRVCEIRYSKRQQDRSQRFERPLACLRC
jgi:hypothetical protein